MTQFHTWKEDWIPHPYQLDATKFAISNSNVLLLADPGMGKTSITLSAISILKSKGFVHKTLIIAPLRPALKSWPDELEKWKCFQNLTYTIIHAGNKEKALKEDVDIYIITTGLVTWLFDLKDKPEKQCKAVVNLRKIEHLGIDFLVVDELSNFKNRSSSRTKVMLEVSKMFSRRMGLTGSFSANNLEDVFSETLIIAGPGLLGKGITKFKYDYFQPLPYDAKAFAKQEPKHDAYEKICKLLSPVTVHLKSEDYLDMPDLMYSNIHVDMPPSATKMYQEMKEDFITQLNNKEITTQNAGTKAMMLRQIASGGLYTYETIPIDAAKGVVEMRKITNVIHNVKTEALKVLINELHGQPLLVLYHFRHDKERITKFLGNLPDMADANTPAKLSEVVDKWNRKQIPVLLGQPQSMGHGLNLQHGGNHIVFYTLDWSFENYDQVIRRLYRQGNNNKTVYVYHILATNTLDSYVLKCVKDKESSQNKIFKWLKIFCEEK